MLRKSASLLLAAMLFLIMCACSVGEAKTKDTDSADTASAETETVNPTSSRLSVEDGLEKRDYDGEEFRIYVMSSHAEQFVVEKQDGEVVNDAVYASNLAVQERFNVLLTTDVSNLDVYAHIESIKNLTLAGDTTYNLMVNHDVLTANASLDGCFLNLYDVPNLDFSRPWWHSTEELTVLGQLYLITSDMIYDCFKRSNVIYCNLDKLADYDLTMPYEEVRSGTWTIDKLISMTKDIYSDLDGNSERNTETDFFGYATEPYCTGLLEAFEMETTVKDDDEVLTNDFDQNKMIAIADKIYKFLFESNGAYCTMQNGVLPTAAFSGQRLLFMEDALERAASEFRNDDDLNYGILPMPKYDEQQENYISNTQPYVSVVPVTLGGDRLELTGTVIEAMSAEGWRRVIPAYFEISLKQKYTCDADSIEMLDIINSTLSEGFSWIYENWAGYNMTLFDMDTTGKNNIASYLETRRSSAAERTKLLVKSFEKLADNAGA